MPAFYQAFLQRAKVYYAVAEEQFLLPSYVNQQRVASLLAENNIPTAYVRVQIVNRGTTGSPRITGSVVVPGRVGEFITQPRANPRPVWVGIETDVDPQFPDSARFRLLDLVPGKVVTASVAYFRVPKDEPAKVDVVYDGQMATRVESIAQAPKLTLWYYLDLPVKVFVAGIVGTLLIGLITVINRNKRVAEALLLLVKELSPTLSRIVEILR